MKPQIIRGDEIKKNDFRSIEVQNLIDDEAYKNLSVAKVKIKGDQKLGLDQESDTAYYVLEGDGKFFIEDDEFTVKKGDLVFIPRGIKYKDAGDLTLLAISTPRFDRDKRVRLED